MISLESIKGFFPEELRSGQFARHILKEYVECLALEWIARSQWAPKLTFIGGTNLRLTKGIDRLGKFYSTARGWSRTISCVSRTRW